MNYQTYLKGDVIKSTEDYHTFKRDETSLVVGDFRSGWEHLYINADRNMSYIGSTTSVPKSVVIKIGTFIE